ncbi:hypothetical protein [Citrobacter koseri]|uniref:hypothetical protein n=1 Tax=Citrobacter koseri TaxID=545 RepID=UPI0034D7A91F
MTTITRELIAAYLNGEVKTLTNSEQKELAHIALASLDAGSDSNDHPAQGPLSNYRLHRISDILRKAATQRDGGNIGYAMSDAVKAFDELLASRGAKPIGITDRSEIECLKRGEMANVMPPDYKGVDAGDEVFVYTAPPAPVANDDLHEAVSDLLAALDKYPEQIVPINRKSFLVRTIRAAMLNGGKS